MALTNSSILDEVKEELRITWTDEDERIQRIIDRAKEDMNSLVGVELDFDNNSQAKTLFLDRCRYDYNNALEYFEDNFHKPITRLIIQEGMKSNAITEER